MSINIDISSSLSFYLSLSQHISFSLSISIYIYIYNTEKRRRLRLWFYVACDIQVKKIILYLTSSFKKKSSFLVAIEHILNTVEHIMLYSHDQLYKHIIHIHLHMYAES